jgi:hypothetical protein
MLGLDGIMRPKKRVRPVQIQGVDKKSAPGSVLPAVRPMAHVDHPARLRQPAVCADPSGSRPRGDTTREYPGHDGKGPWKRSVRPSLLLSLGLIVVALALPSLARPPEIQPVSPSLLRTLAPAIAPASSPVLLTSTAPASHPAVSGHPSASSSPEDRQTQPPPTAKPQPARVAVGSVEGKASWYCVPGRSRCPTFAHGGLFAAAGPALRVGNWRGRYVTVWYGKAHVTVQLIDSCERGCTVAIDLFGDAFAQLAPLGTGRIDVRVTW